MDLGVQRDRWFPPMPIQPVSRNGKYPSIANHTHMYLFSDENMAIWFRKSHSDYVGYYYPQCKAWFVYQRHPKSWVDTLQVSTKMPSFGWVSWSHFWPSFWFSSLDWVVISSQWLSTFKTAWKSNKLEMQMGQIKDAILQWPIFARIYARGKAGTAVAGNKLTLMLNSIEQDSAVARLSHFWIYFSKIFLLETFFRSQTYLISTVIHCSKKQKCLAKNIYFKKMFLILAFSCRTEEHNSWILNLINCCGVNSIFWPGSIKFCLREQFSILRKPRTFG